MIGRTLHLSWILIAFVTLFAPLSLRGATGGRVGCVGLMVSSPQLPAATTQSFSATRAIDLELYVLFTQGDASRFSRNDHVVELHVFTPRGSLYQSFTIPFSNDKRFKGQKVRIPGYPEPVAVQVLEKKAWGKGAYQATKFTLPVAGTPIINNSLYGQWRAEAFVEGDRLACSKPATFMITQ